MIKRFLKWLGLHKTEYKTIGQMAMTKEEVVKNIKEAMIRNNQKRGNSKWL